MLENKLEEALVEYRTALKLSPNRLNGLLSAGKTAEQAQHSEEAMKYYKAAAQQTDSGKHSQREDLARAVKATLVASRSGDLPAMPVRSGRPSLQPPMQKYGLAHRSGKIR